jgi:nucleoside-diphosphate-sugar epimerase
MRESDRLEPNSYYAVAKAAQTHLGQFWSQRLDLAVVCLRLFSIYGPWEEPTRLIPTLIRRARAGLPLELAAPETARDFVYVDDLLEVLLDFPRLQNMPGEIVNIGSGRQTTLADLVRDLLEVVPSRSEVRWGAFPARRWDASHWSADVTKAEQLLAWRARHDLKQGLARTAAWMSRMGDDYGSAQLRAAA